MGLVTALGIGATALGGALSASSQKKAAKTAANASTYAADQSAAVQREQLGIAQNALSPYVARGNVAGDAMNALLGFGGTGPTYSNPTPQPNALMPYTSGGMIYEGMDGPMGGYGTSAREQWGGAGYGAGEPMGAYPAYSAPAAMGGGFGGGVPQGQTPQQAANNAFDIFRNSTGYQFRLGEGMDALNSGWAGAGTLQSGAAAKAALEYGQNFASNEFGNYMSYLGNQQGVGFSGASALAGVGQGYANSIANINQARADAQGNAALIAGNNNPFANALGMIGGGLWQMGR